MNTILPGRIGIEWPPIPSGLLRRTVPWGEASLLAMTDAATVSAATESFDTTSAKFFGKVDFEQLCGKPLPTIEKH